MVELTEIKRSLQSSTLKHRREAVKQLDAQLSSARFLHQLDTNTVKLWPEDRLQLVSWPGLADTYLNYMEKEVTEHRKQLDAAAIKVFKTIFTAADDVDRCGAGRNNLLRRAGVAFDKLTKMLETFSPGEGLASPLGKEATSVLLRVLLPNPAYCQRGSVTAFQGLLEEAMLRVEALMQQVDDSTAKAAQQSETAAAAARLASGTRVAAVQRELHSMANLLAGLLAGMPGRMDGTFVIELLAFLAATLSWLDKLGEYGHVSRQLMACLNGVLLAYGADLRPVMLTTHKSLASYVKHAWTAHTNVPVKEGVLCYCRLALALGGVQAAASSGTGVGDLLNLVTKEINASGFAWDLPGKRQHQQLAPLAASFYYHAGLAPGAASSTSTAAGAAPAAAADAAAAASELGSAASNGAASGGAAQGNRSKKRSSSAGGRDSQATAAAARAAAKAAAAAAAAATSGDEVGSDDDIMQLPRKRSRVLGPAGQLLMHLQADPVRWGPVVASLLHQYGPLIPPSFLAVLQQQLTASTARCLAALQQQLQQQQQVAGAGRGLRAGAASGLDRPSMSPSAPSGAAAAAAPPGGSSSELQQQLLWLCWCLSELAVCWPAALHTLGGGGAARAGQGAAADTAAVGAAASNPAAGSWGSLGVAFDPLSGSCSQQPWGPAEAASAQGTCTWCWQQLWGAGSSLLAAGGAMESLQPNMVDGVVWLLHVLVSQKLVHLPSKTGALLQLQQLWLPQQHQEIDGAEEPGSYEHQQPQVVLSDAQLALLLSLCLGQRALSQRDMQLRQQLLQACLSTAEACSGDNSMRQPRRSSGGRAAGLVPAAAALPAVVKSGKPLPDLLLPATLAVLGAPGLPTPGLNGAAATCTMATAAACKLAAVQRSWCVMPIPADTVASLGAGAAAAAGQQGASISGMAPNPWSNSGSGCEDTTWYAAADVWLWADLQLEAQLAGLESGCDALRRQLAAEQKKQLLAGASTADAAQGATLSGSDALPPAPAAAPAGAAAADAARAGAAPAAAPAAERSGSVGWWKPWCEMADEAAERLSKALLPFTPAGQLGDGFPWGMSQETGDGIGAAAAAAAAAARDPVRSLCYLLFLLNVSVSLPCIAAPQHRLHQQQLQQLDTERQRQQRGLAGNQQQQPQPQQQQPQDANQGIFCGFNFSGHPEQHQQLQQVLMQAGIKAGEMLAGNLQQLPCQPGSTWLQQLMHLGASLARIQALMVAMPFGQETGQIVRKYQGLAAASFLAEVVKVLQNVTKQAADMASAEFDEEDGQGNAGAFDLMDDDFLTAAPAHSRQTSFAPQQPAASMLPSQAGGLRGTQAGAHASARPTAGSMAAPSGAFAAAGPAVFVGGGLAGFAGRAAEGLGNPSASFSPAVLTQHAPGSVAGVGGGAQPGFALGGLGEGLAGLVGVEGAGLRVFVALGPAYPDTAQALMRLWLHMAGLAGWAPPETLLQAVVEAGTSAVCAGGWSHLQQLFGLMKGSHTLLSAQKVPASTSHLILRLLQQVATAAAASRINLDVPCAVPGSQASQEPSELSSQEEPRGHSSTTYVSVMFDICADAIKRLGGRQELVDASLLTESTQLQLGLTTLALLQLQPLSRYASASAGVAEQLSNWRQRFLLALLSSPSGVLRARAAPLAAAMLTAAAADAAVAGQAAAESEPDVAAGVSELMKAGVSDINGYLFLQDSQQLTQDQAARVKRRQDAEQQLKTAPSSSKEALLSTYREAHTDVLAWQLSVLQLVGVARAATAAAVAGLQQQEPPNVLDTQLLLLLLRHAASIQLLPDAVLACQAPANHNTGQAASSAVAVRASALDAAAVALDTIAAQQGYSSRFALLLYHRRAWTKEWVAAGCTVQQLLAIQDLICPAGLTSSQLEELLLPPSAALEAAIGPAVPVDGSEAAAAGGSGGSNSDAAAAAGTGMAHSMALLLQAYGSSLVFWSIFYKADSELSALAAAAGLEEPALLQLYTYELCSCLYPMLKVPELKQHEHRFRAKLQQNAEDLSQDDNLAIVFSIFENVLPLLPPAKQLEQQQPPSSAALNLPVTLPFITQAAASRGLGTVVKLFNDTSWLSALSLSPAGIQTLLLRMHRSLMAAANPLHRLQRLGQLQCLISQLPPEQLQSPAVACSLTSMLLQQVQVPELQGVCCSCLQLLLAAVAKGMPDAFNAQGQDIRSSKKQADAAAAAAVTPKQQQQLLQEQHAEKLLSALLQDLCTQVAAALVQCAEVAAACAQSQQQLQLWGPPAGAPWGLRQQAAAAWDLPMTWALVSLLLFVSHTSYTKALQGRLDLLPPLPVFEQAARLNSGLGSSMGVLLPWFASRVVSMAPSSRQRTARELLLQLRRESGAGLLKGQSKLPVPSVQAAAFQLARRGAELGDPHVQQLAAEVLAWIGPMEPDVLTLSPCSFDANNSSNGASAGSSSKSQQDSPRVTPITHPERTAFPLRPVLQLLVDGLFAAEPWVVATAQRTLAALAAALGDEVVQAALEPAAEAGATYAGVPVDIPVRDPLLVQSCVSVFLGGAQLRSSRVVGRAAAATAAASQAAASVELWSAAGKPYKQWLCSLSSTILTACGAVQDVGAAAAAAPTRRSNRASAGAPVRAPVTAAVLALLADAAALSPHLAELLLPHAVIRLCESDHSGADVPGTGSQGWAARLGAAATAGLQLHSLGSPAARVGSSGSGGSGGWGADAAGLGLLAAAGAGGEGGAGGGGGGVAAADSVDGRCLSLLLACLEHNRSIHRIALASLPCDPVPAPAEWHRCYCLHLDYIAVAAAAMAVKAYFTALLYVEQWCTELQHGGLNPYEGAVADSTLLQLQQLAGVNNATGTAGADGLDAAQQGVQLQQQQMLEQLLLELYSNISDPDGIYAVLAAFGGPASQLQQLKHEQQWAAVLGGQDAQLQAASLQQLQQSSSGTQVAGAITALQRFGCLATAQHCITGTLMQQQQQQRHPGPNFAAPPGTAYDGRQQQQQQLLQLTEAQHELTWRLSDWGLDGALNPAAASGPSFSTPQQSQLGSVGAGGTGSSSGRQAGQQGFHGAVCAALSALQQGDSEGLGAAVLGAQQQCILQLARSSTQSAAAVNPLLVQLQMLQMLLQSQRVQQPAAPAADAALDWSSESTEELLQALVSRWHCADGSYVPIPHAAASLGTLHYVLSDQLLALQAAVTKALGRPDGLVATLHATAKVARKAGQANFAAAALQQLQETLRQGVLGAGASARGLLAMPPAAAAAAGAGSSGGGSSSVQLPRWLQRAVAWDAEWPLEAVKLRWMQGQHQAALKELQGLAANIEVQLAGMYRTAAEQKQKWLQGQRQQLAAAGGKGSASARVIAPRVFVDAAFQHSAQSLACRLIQARVLLGKWLAGGAGSSSNIQAAMAELQKAAKLAPQYEQLITSMSADTRALHSRACFQLAACADQHYQVLDAQIASPEFQKQQQVLRTKEQLLEQLREPVEASRNWQRLPPGKQQSAKAMHQQAARRQAETERQVLLDRQAIQQLQNSRRLYLDAALSAYSQCIAAGDTHDLQVVYRMCGLWFRHSDDEAVNKHMQQTFQAVPIAKFMPLVYQMASRLDNTNSDFQVVLMEALFLMATHHIYHALYPIIALSKGVTEEAEPVAKTAHVRHVTNTGRVAAATALLQRICAVEPLRPIADDMVAQVTELIAMTLQVHKMLPRDARGSVAVDQFTMPAQFRRKLRSLEHAPPICYSLPLDPSRKYEDVPHVVEIDSTIKLAGGINSPLIVRSTDNYGRMQRQLCKCNDDLRQDAVMQQFFGLVNTLLGGSPDSNLRRLSMRTYRVVPCSPLVGVLEWVEGTVPFTEYLLGDRSSTYSGGACARYHHHGDWTWYECFTKFDKVQPTQLRDTFLQCCAHFPPVFRHFFLEAFPHPSDWFEARTRYTRSTAVASMAGAVIGLGDRHNGNILLDMNTAEVVHIDLGIAFEQGMFLTTPERVPFRLTANIVDGMGAAGVEGTFRRCCETALQVLRHNQDALLTVVQVVLHDPLYRWQMTPFKAGRKQPPMPAAEQDGDALTAAAASDSLEGAAGGTAAAAGASSGGLGNADAERAVLRVKQKLQGQGLEGGVSVSVAAQVAAWLQSAQDPDNLCRMYKGWSAWV